MKMHMKMLLVQFFVLLFTVEGYQYDPNEAWELAMLSAASYGDRQNDCLQRLFNETYRIIQKIQKPCDELHNDCTAYIAEEPAEKRLLVVYRGTKNFGQLVLEGVELLEMSDFYGLGKVVHYFNQAHVVMWEDVSRVLENEKYQNWSVTFTGHSLGGALAALGALKAGQDFGDFMKIKMISFGQPRVGDVVLAENFNVIVPDSFRVIFRQDLVPHIPACYKNVTITSGDRKVRPCSATKRKNMYHHSTEIWYQKEMQSIYDYKTCTGFPKNEDTSCSDQVQFFYTDISKYISDHRHYFGVNIPYFGRDGCNLSNPEGTYRG